MIVIFHNPACETSRNVLAFIRAVDEPVAIPYLETGWTRAQLLALFPAAGVTARQALRTSGTPAAELGMTAPGVTDEALIAAMVAHPILVNRPFVVTPPWHAPVPPFRDGDPAAAAPTRTADQRGRHHPRVGPSRLPLSHGLAYKRGRTGHRAWQAQIRPDSERGPE